MCDLATLAPTLGKPALMPTLVRLHTGYLVCNNRVSRLAVLGPKGQSEGRTEVSLLRFEYEAFACRFRTNCCRTSGTRDAPGGRCGGFARYSQGQRRPFAALCRGVGEERDRRNAAWGGAGAPLRRPRGRAATLRRGGRGSARGAVARLPAVLVRVEAPDPGA